MNNDTATKLRDAIADVLNSDPEFLALPLDQSQNVINQLAADVFDWKTPKEEPLEMKLCETQRLILRPNVPYIFRADDTCKPCMTIGEFSDSLSRVVEPQAAPPDDRYQAIQADMNNPGN